MNMNWLSILRLLNFKNIKNKTLSSGRSNDGDVSDYNATLMIQKYDNILTIAPTKRNNTSIAFPILSIFASLLFFTTNVSLMVACNCGAEGDADDVSTELVPGQVLDVRPASTVLANCGRFNSKVILNDLAIQAMHKRSSQLLPLRLMMIDQFVVDRPEIAEVVESSSSHSSEVDVEAQSLTERFSVVETFRCADYKQKPFSALAITKPNSVFGETQVAYANWDVNLQYTKFLKNMFAFANQYWAQESVQKVLSGKQDSDWTSANVSDLSGRLADMLGGESSIEIGATSKLLRYDVLPTNDVTLPYVKLSVTESRSESMAGEGLVLKSWHTSQDSSSKPEVNLFAQCGEYESLQAISSLTQLIFALPLLGCIQHADAGYVLVNAGQDRVNGVVRSCFTVNSPVVDAISMACSLSLMPTSDSFEHEEYLASFLGNRFKLLFAIPTNTTLQIMPDVVGDVPDGSTLVKGANVMRFVTKSTKNPADLGKDVVLTADGVGQFFDWTNGLLESLHLSPLTNPADSLANITEIYSRLALLESAWTTVGGNPLAGQYSLLSSPSDVSGLNTSNMFLPNSSNQIDVIGLYARLARSLMSLLVTGEHDMLVGDSNAWFTNLGVISSAFIDEIVVVCVNQGSKSLSQQAIKQYCGSNAPGIWALYCYETLANYLNVANYQSLQTAWESDSVSTGLNARDTLLELNNALQGFVYYCAKDTNAKTILVQSDPMFELLGWADQDTFYQAGQPVFSILVDGAVNPIANNIIQLMQAVVAITVDGESGTATLPLVSVQAFSQLYKAMPFCDLAFYQSMIDLNTACQTATADLVIAADLFQALQQDMKSVFTNWLGSEVQDVSDLIWTDYAICLTAIANGLQSSTLPTSLAMSELPFTGSINGAAQPMSLDLNVIQMLSSANYNRLIQGLLVDLMNYLTSAATFGESTDMTNVTLVESLLNVSKTQVPTAKAVTQAVKLLASKSSAKYSIVDWLEFPSTTRSPANKVLNKDGQVDFEKMMDVNLVAQAQANFTNSDVAANEQLAVLTLLSGALAPTQHVEHDQLAEMTDEWLEYGHRLPIRMVGKNGTSWMTYFSAEEMSMNAKSAEFQLAVQRSITGKEGCMRQMIAQLRTYTSDDETIQKQWGESVSLLERMTKSSDDSTVESVSQQVSQSASVAGNPPVV